MMAAAGRDVCGAHLRERKRKVTRSLVDGNASEGRKGETADDLSLAMPHDDRHVRRRRWDNGQKAADVPFTADMPRDRHRDTAFRGGLPDNSSSYGRMEGSRGIIVREEEQIVPLIAATQTCCRRERTQGSSFFFLNIWARSLSFNTRHRM